MITIYSILLVDDSSFMRKYIANILNDTKKYNVIAEASNGREAILKFHSYKPDIVIMDVTMDEMDGIQALKHLVRLYPGIKVIMCSSLGHHFYVDECLKNGAKAFLVKSNLKEILNVLDKVVA
ncbi:response regulator [Oceanobacillus alkalisoli]|uniref:response regulator n=1 Tax=Oceanobacillus alkalisoli TaxID=2925113 RepID=UPI002873CEEF|nr:response regulator [Oceanobacillus alkalisoli]